MSKRKTWFKLKPKTFKFVYIPLNETKFVEKSGEENIEVHTNKYAVDPENTDPMKKSSQPDYKYYGTFTDAELVTREDVPEKRLKEDIVK